MSDSIRRGYIEHPERIEKIRQKALGRKPTKESREKMSLNSAKAILIDIDGELGSIRYWAKKINMSHPPLIYRKNKYGIKNLIEYIKQKLNNQVKRTSMV